MKADIVERMAFGRMPTEADCQDAADEIIRLRTAVSWMADYDPQLVAAAREKFALDIG